MHVSRNQRHLVTLLNLSATTQKAAHGQIRTCMARESWRKLNSYMLTLQHHSHFQTRLSLCSVGCMSDFRHESPAQIELGRPAFYPDVEILAQRGKSKCETSFQLCAALNDSASLMQATLALPVDLLTTVVGASRVRKKCSFSRLPKNAWGVQEND
ncbi:hypothetical protein BDR22DRAFT_171041 [Usnea florida]